MRYWPVPASPCQVTNAQDSPNTHRTQTVSAPQRTSLSGNRTELDLRLQAWMQPPVAQQVRTRAPNIKDEVPQIMHRIDTVLTLCLRILGKRFPPVCAPNPSSSSFDETFSCTKACMDVILARPAAEIESKADILFRRFMGVRSYMSARK